VAHGHGGHSDEKVVFVGDSRVRKNTKVYLPRDYSAYPGKSEAFIPNFLLKEWMVGVVVLVGILVLVMSDPAPLGYPADPTNTSFIPMPDWYFLFLYQLLKYAYTSDQFIILGTVIVPGISFGALLLAPFLDTGKERRFYKRPITSSLMILSLIAVGYLTMVSWHHYEEELKATNTIPETEKREAELIANVQAGKPTPSPTAQKNQLPAIVAAEDPGAEVYKKATCVSCHGGDLKGMPAAGIPALRGVGDKFSKDDIMGIIKNGKDNKMPAQYKDNIAKGLTDAQMDQLAGWLAKQKSQ
jgi:menaquinol-cytochrome c reductase cytochrome b/c subunit